MDINLNELTDTVAKQRAGTSGFLAGQDVTSADYLKRYTDFINSQEGATAMAGRIGSELGIPTLQANATQLRNTLTNLPSTYSKATTGYDVNANQLARIIGQKSSELSPAVTTAETSLANAENVLGQRMGYEQTDQAKALLPYTAEQNMLNDRLARETTLYTQDNQNELNALITKIQSGITLSEGEKNRANQLAIQEKSYQNALEVQKSKNAGQAPISTDTGDWMWDNQSGTWVPVYD
jgi:S-adenosylmethionine synthetase